MKRLATTLFCIVVALVACASVPTEGPLPERAYRITDIPRQYVGWWKDVERCAGRTKPLARVTWYLVVNRTDDGFPWRNPYTGRTEWVAGLAYSDRNVIVMGTTWLFSPPHVKHEMLHLIASPTGHDSALFQVACRDQVACVGQCLRP